MIYHDSRAPHALFYLIAFSPKVNGPKVPTAFLYLSVNGVVRSYIITRIGGWHIADDRSCVSSFNIIVHFQSGYQRDQVNVVYIIYCLDHLCPYMPHSIKMTIFQVDLIPHTNLLKYQRHSVHIPQFKLWLNPGKRRPSPTHYQMVA